MTLRIVAGKFKGRQLKAPKGDSTRPTQGMLREAVFNMCQNEIEGAAFLDLFAGSGAMAFEALSRGARAVTMVEHNRLAIACLRENIALLQVEGQANVIAADYSRAVASLLKQWARFDILYIDPPYDLPFKLDMVAPLVADGGVVFFEERYDPKKLDLPKVEKLVLRDTRRFGTARLSILNVLT